jgi:hypothetical protein
MELCGSVDGLREEIARLASDTKQLLRRVDVRSGLDLHGTPPGDGSGRSRSATRSATSIAEFAGGGASPTAPVNTSGVHAVDELLDVHLGANSAPAFAASLSSGSAPPLLPPAVLPTFALGDDRATYPFESLWGLQQSPHAKLERLRGLIPSDIECARIYREYLRTAFVLFPAVVDVDGFGEALAGFVAERRRGKEAVVAESLQGQMVYGRDMHWLGLFFAVMAAGMQCSDRPLEDRDLKSNVYGRSHDLL